MCIKKLCSQFLNRKIFQTRFLKSNIDTENILEHTKMYPTIYSYTYMLSALIQ